MGGEREGGRGESRTPGLRISNSWGQYFNVIKRVRKRSKFSAQVGVGVLEAHKLFGLRTNRPPPPPPETYTSALGVLQERFGGSIFCSARCYC